MGTDQRVSTYLQYLPAIFWQGTFLGRFLLAFESVLSGGVAGPDGEALPLGLEELLGKVHVFFDPDPGKAPKEFLPWLAQWAAASLRDDWTEPTWRAFLGQVVPLYKKRGTRAGIEQVLRICIGDVDVSEIDRQDVYGYPIAFLVGDPPQHWPGFDDTVRAHHFQVVLRVAERDPARLARTARQAMEIIDREKPAHTTYSLRIEYPAMKIADPVVRDMTQTTTTPDGRTVHPVLEGVVINESTVLGSTIAKV
jgi:P2-related tail formation protein